MPIVHLDMDDILQGQGFKAHHRPIFFSLLGVDIDSNITDTNKRCIFYDRQSTNNIVKYNLRTERGEKQIGLGGSARKTSYQWGGYTQVDLAVDEQGLWALWGYNGNSYRLRAQKIDVFYGYNTHGWNLGTGTTTTIEVLELNTKYHEILLRLKSVLVRSSNKKTMAVVNIFPQSFLKCAG